MAFETRLTPAMAARWRGAGLWSDETSATVLARRVRETPDREALTDGTRRLTYRELARRHRSHGGATCARSASAQGDVVTIQLPNWIEFAFVFFALERLGAVAVTVSVDFRSRELEYIMRFAGSKMLVCCAQFRDFDHAAMAAELKPRLPRSRCIGVVRGTPLPRHGEPRRRRGDAAARPRASCRCAMDADTVMRMAFTSGTTGNPKGVMHSHNTTLAAGRILNGDVGLAADDVMLIWLPLGLNWGYLTLVQSILAGAKAVLLDRFRPAAALDLIERERVTYIPTAPASLTTILQEPDLARRDLSSLRIVVSGGASAPVETIRAWRRAAPGVLLELLGMLETGYQAYTRADRRPRTAWRARSGVPPATWGCKLVDARRPRRRARRGGRYLLRWTLGASRLSQQPGRQRRSLPAGRLVPQRRSRHDRCRRESAHRRTAQGDDQPRRQEVLPARDRGNPLHPSAGALRRDRRHSRPAAGRAQLPVPGAAPGRDADAGEPRRLPRRQRRHLQAAGAARAVHAIPVHPDRQDPAPRARARGRGADVAATADSTRIRRTRHG